MAERRVKKKRSERNLDLGGVVGRRRRLGLAGSRRGQHMYVCGSTGVGKSKFLEHLIRQDIARQRREQSGLLLIDPHGSLYDEILRWLASNPVLGERPVVPLDLRDADHTIAYNPLRPRPAGDPAVVVGNLVRAIAHVWGASDTSATPQFRQWAHNLLTLVQVNGWTLADLPKLAEPEAPKRYAHLADKVADPLVRNDWEAASYDKPGEYQEKIQSTLRRLRPFLGIESLKAMFGQSGPSLDLDRALDEGWVVLVSLGQDGGMVNREASDLVATLLLSDVWTAAQQRGKRDDLRPFRVYLDEFQRFVSPAIAENLDQARGYGLELTVAHQFPGQLLHEGDHGKKLYDSLVVNARSKVAFQTGGQENLTMLGSELFRKVMDPDEVKHQLYSRTVMDYRLEYQKAYGHARSVSEGGSETRSTTEGEGTGGGHGTGAGVSEALRTNPPEAGLLVDPPELRDVTETNSSSESESESWNQYMTQTHGTTMSWNESETTSESQVPMLMPVMGDQLSTIQYRSLDEQLFRAMAVLYDQEQRQAVALLEGMKAPASIFTPFVKPGLARPERVNRYLERIHGRLGCSLPRTEALGNVQPQTSALDDQPFTHRNGDAQAEEPDAPRRRVR